MKPPLLGFASAARPSPALAGLFAAAFVLIALIGVARAETPNPGAVAADLFAVPEAAITVGKFAGNPPSAEVRRDGRTIGYLISSWQAIRSVGFSGKPVDVWLAIDLKARVAGARLIAHQEPILVIGVAPEDLERYVDGFAGLDLATGAPGDTVSPGPGPDAVSGATVSSAVIRDAVLRAGREVALDRGLLGTPTDRPRLDRAGYREAGWQELLDEGAVVHRRITRAEVAQALGAPPDDRPEDLFIEPYAALATMPAVGQNLLGRRLYESLLGAIGPADNLVLIAADGLYSFKGTAYRQTGVFDRIEIRQGDKTIKLTADGYRNVQRLAAEGAPEVREAGVFVVPESTGFDPTRPWDLALLVTRQTSDGGLLAAEFTLRYQVPARYIVGAAEAATPAAAAPRPALWQEIWHKRLWEVALLSVMLAVLATILVFQDALARRYRLYRRVRLSFLTVTLVWLGWIAGAQLSVVNVLTFSQALLTGFQWELFLLDPLIFILWCFVALGMLFWGRGVFCGWLCPFGALQELLNTLAQRLRIPQLEIPFGLHERLWPIKYIIFLALFAISLNSVTMAFQGAEVEPFKTAISLKFVRAWPFVVYAVALLVAGLFVQRFFCRYLCPLGAALAIPARLRMFEWLKRKVQCGRECRICAQRCPVQAIHPLGQINPNECIHCLNCQTLYYDETTCPPLIARAQRRARRQAGAAAVAGAEAGDG
jgi:transcriptional regulator of nitric oxide reductase/ferredoxin